MLCFVALQCRKLCYWPRSRQLADQLSVTKLLSEERCLSAASFMSQAFPVLPWCWWFCPMEFFCSGPKNVSVVEVAELAWTFLFHVTVSSWKFTVNLIVYFIYVRTCRFPWGKLAWEIEGWVGKASIRCCLNGFTASGCIIYCMVRDTTRNQVDTILQACDTSEHPHNASFVNEDWLRMDGPSLSQVGLFQTLHSTWCHWRVGFACA